MSNTIWLRQVFGLAAISLLLIGCRKPPLAQETIAGNDVPGVGQADKRHLWETLVSPKGYQIKYPREFILEERAEGFYVLLPPDAQSELDIAFAIDDRGVMTIVERWEERKASLIDPVFTALDGLEVEGYIVEGTVGPGYGEGLYEKSVYLDLHGRELIFSCQGPYCRSDLFGQILSTFQLHGTAPSKP